jgi:ribosome-binding protein aMBF1 (putative translation factor)
MANKQKQTWEQKAQAEMESKSKGKSVDTLISCIEDNGGSMDVNQIMDQLGLDCPKKVRVPFQKAGLKGETLAKEINGKRVKLNKGTTPQTYIVE